LSLLSIDEVVFYRIGELGGFHLLTRSSCGEEFHQSPKVAHVRPVESCDSCEDRLENVVPTSFNQTSPDKSHVGDRVELCELADLIEHDHFWSFDHPTLTERTVSESNGESVLACSGRNRACPLDVPRRQEQGEISEPSSQLLEGGEDQLFFTRVSAASHPTERGSGVTELRLVATPDLTRSRERPTIELQVSEFENSTGLHSESDKSLRAPTVGRVDLSDSRKEGSNNRRPESEPLDRSLGNPAIDDDNRDPPAIRLENHLRPDFELNEHDQLGPQRVQHSLHTPRKVEGIETDRNFGITSSSDVSGSGGRRRDHELRSRPDTGQLAQKRIHCLKLPDANRMNPDSFSLRKRDLPASKSFPQ